MRRRVSTIFVGGLVAAVLLTGGIGGVSLSAQGSVNACVNSSSGEVKILLAGGSCKPGWVSMELPTGSGESAGGGGPRLLDADDKDVGAYAYAKEDGDLFVETVLREVAPYWLLIHVSENGFRATSTAKTVFYESDNCTGPVFFYIGPNGPLARVTHLRDGLLHFAGNPIQSVTIYSYKGIITDTGADYFPCFSTGAPGYTDVFAPETTVDSGTFGLTTPFHLVDQ